MDLGSAIRLWGIVLTGSCLCPNSTPSGTGVRAGSFSPGAFFSFFRCALQGSTRRGQTKQKKNIHETSKLNSHSDRDCLLWAFATNASSSASCPGTGRVLSRLHDSGRLPSSSKSYYGRWKYRSWLAFALFSRCFQLQHRRRCWNTGPQHRGFQYRSGHCSDVTEHHRYKEHRPWNCSARL